MATTSPIDYERESREVVEEFLQRDLLSRATTRRVERLCEENRTSEALEVILAERRSGVLAPSTDHRVRNDPRLL